MESQTKVAWMLEVRHGRKLKFAAITKSGTPGKWRVVGKEKKSYWKIGDSSGLPLNLFSGMRETILDAVRTIRENRKRLTDVRSQIRRGLFNAARHLGCDSKQISKTEVEFILDHKPLIHWLLVDFHKYREGSFFKEDKNGKRARGRRGQPVRDLGKLADKIRRVKRTRRLKEIESKSKALLRWMVVLLADGAIWVVPAKARKDK
jgi:hypothetical protein